MAIDFIPTAYVGMLNGTVYLNSTTPTAIRVGTENLKNRKWLMIQVAGTVNIFIGSSTDADVLNSEDDYISKYELAKCGIKVPKGDIITLPVSDKITIYGIAQSTGCRLRVAELA